MERKKETEGVFGCVYKQFRGKVKEAFAFLLLNQSGDLLGVFYRDGIGSIDLVWGDETCGLKHILFKHTGEGKSFATIDEAAEVIERIIQYGNVLFEDGDKVVIGMGNKWVTLRKNIRKNGKKIADKNWVLTAYDISVNDNTSVIVVTNQGEATHATDVSTHKGKEKNDRDGRDGGKKLGIIKDKRMIAHEYAKILIRELSRKMKRYRAVRRDYYVYLVAEQFGVGLEMNRNSLYNIADQCGVTHESDQDKRIMLQLTEFAMVRAYRKISGSFDEKYAAIVKLYKRQPIIGIVTNVTREYQQYSTPAPLAFLMGSWCNWQLDRSHYYSTVKVFEPSAGNGMLTIAFEENRCDVNELEETRYNNLCDYTSYHEVTNQDGTLPFAGKERKYPIVLTNPPFGSVGTKEDGGRAYLTVDGYELRKKEFVMAYRALECMRDDGRCAIIVGGDLNNDYYDEWGFYKKPADKLFYSWLYANYHVAAVLNIDGDLYARQGTTYNVRMILVDGRHAFKKEKPAVNREVIHTFDELRDAVLRNAVAHTL